MNWALRWLIGTAFFLGILLFGSYVLGIHPTFAEMLLVAVATGVSNGISEALR